MNQDNSPSLLTIVKLMKVITRLFQQIKLLTLRINVSH